MVDLEDAIFGGSRMDAKLPRVSLTVTAAPRPSIGRLLPAEKKSLAHALHRKPSDKSRRVSGVIAIGHVSQRVSFHTDIQTEYYVARQGLGKAGSGEGEVS